MVEKMGCKCDHGFFGFDCSQEAVRDEVNSVPPRKVVAGAAADLFSAAGLGVSLPAGALSTNATLEVQIYDVEVKVSDEQPGNPIAPAGSIGVFLPHGLQFAQPVTLTLKYDPGKVPAGDDVFVFYFNEDATPPVWEKMPSVVVGNTGLIRCNTTHFSMFGPMATAGSAGPIVSPSETKALQSTPLPEDSPSVIANNGGDSGAIDLDASAMPATSNATLVIVLATVGGILGVLLLVVGVCLLMQPSNKNKKNSDDELEGTIGFVPGLQASGVHGIPSFSEENLLRDASSAFNPQPAQRSISVVSRPDFVSSTHEMSSDPPPALLSIPADASTAIFGTLGRTWEEIGPSRPETGVEIKDKKLQDALRTLIAADLRLEFTRTELVGFGDLNLTTDSYIRVDDAYFKAMGRPGSDRSSTTSSHIASPAGGVGATDADAMPRPLAPLVSATPGFRSNVPKQVGAGPTSVTSNLGASSGAASISGASPRASPAMPALAPFDWLAATEASEWQTEKSVFAAGSVALNRRLLASADAGPRNDSASEFRHDNGFEMSGGLTLVDFETEHFAHTRVPVSSSIRITPEPASPEEQEEPSRPPSPPPPITPMDLALSAEPKIYDW
jgi:hypothetical protein